jgi:sugar phosphate isomerase/epimerase
MKLALALQTPGSADVSSAPAGTTDVRLAPRPDRSQEAAPWASSTPIKPVPVALLTGSFEEKLAKAARWGAHGIELMTTQPANLDRQRILAALQANRLEVAAIASGGLSFSLGLTLLHADPQTAARANQALYALIDLAHDLNAPLVTIGSFRGRLSACPGDGRGRLADILRQAAAYAQDHGVRLVLEPLNRYESDLIATAAQGLEFLDEVGHPALGLLLDTYHVNIEERSWSEPFLLLARLGKLWHVHLGDNNRLPPGQGLIDFPAIVGALRQAGYHGYLSAELLPRPDPDTAARQTLAYMLPLLGEIPA